MGLGGIDANPITAWKRIGDSDLEGAVQRDLIWIRGPCGTHCLSFHNASALGAWLLDQTAVTVEGTAEDVTGVLPIGFGT